MAIAEVYYDYGQKIPIWTKHTLYGASLAAPIAAFESIEEIVYQDDPGDNQIPHLKNIIQSYYDFNVGFSFSPLRTSFLSISRLELRWF